MYYCAKHQIAYEEARQWTGHWLHGHAGEPRPKAEEVFVEQVPEGTKIAPPSTPKPVSQRAPPRPAGSDDTVPFTPPPPPATPVYVEEDELHLDQLLDAIGVPQPQRQTIVKGWRNLPVLHQHPANLENYIVGIVGPKFRASVPLAVHGMFPAAEQEAPSPQYMYAQAPYGRPAPFWPGHRPSPYQRPWEPEESPYDYRYFRPAPGAESPEANPQMVALQKQLDAILVEQQAERAERLRERQEQEQKDRDAAWQAQLNAVVGKVDSTFKEFGDMIKGLGDQIQRGRGDVEASQNQQLAEKVDTLTHTIADQREAHLQGTVESLRGDLAEVRQKLNAEPTGKTTEDLLSQGLPLAIAEVRSMGAAVTGELKGIRQQAADGKLPILTPPNPPGAAKPGDQGDPVKTAQQIAGARALEDDILSMAGGQPRN